MKDTKPKNDGPPKPPPVDPYEVLAALVDAVAAGKNRVERMNALSAHMLTGPALDRVAWLLDTDPGHLEKEITRLKAIEGMSGPAADLRRVIADRFGTLSKSKHLRVLNAGDAAPFACPYDFTPPPGYLVDSSGVYRIANAPDGGTVPVRIAFGPLILVGHSEDVETEDVYVTVAWLTPHGQWREEIVPRQVAADGRAIVALAAHGAPVAGPLGREVALYLAAAEAACKAPLELTSPRMGWTRGAFVVGRDVYRPSANDAPTLTFRGEHGADQIADFYRRSGTWEGWLSAWALVSAYPIAAASVYVACASPFLEILGASSFIVDWSAKPGSGKTTALRLGSSVWGEPTERAQIRSWSITPTYLERVAWIGCDLPLFLDDTNRIPANQRDGLSTTIYMITNGQGKGRGTVGGVQRMVSWRTVVLSTGEARMTSYTQEAGAHARVISLTGYPLGTGKDARGAERSEALREIVEAHHGHLGERLARWLMQADRAKIRTRYAEIVAKYADPAGLPNATTRRFSPRVALLELVANILHGPLGLPRPEADVIAEVWRQVQSETEDADMPAEALRFLQQHASSQSTRFWGRHVRDRDSQAVVPTAGWLGVWSDTAEWDVIAIYPKDVRAILERGGYAYDLITSEWKSRGWLKTEGKGLTWKIHLDKERARLITIKRSALAAVDAVDGGRP